MSQTKAELINAKGDAIFDTDTLVVDSANNRVGIGTTSPSVRLHVNVDSASETDVARFQATDGADIQFLDIGVDAANNLVSYDATGSTGGAHVFRRGGGEVMRLDTSSRLLVGTSSDITGSTNNVIQAVTTAGARLALGRDDASVSAGDDIGLIQFFGNDGGTFEECARIFCEADDTHAAGDKPSRLVFSTTADGASSPTERMRIGSTGEISFTTPGTNGYLAHYYCNGGANTVIEIEESSTGGVPAISGIIRVGKATSNSRSINATGTINASGSDYAEYMTKSGNFTINKGDICGITADGLLTNQFMDAISFVVKSTLPSYVGGDTWGLGLPEKSEELETARQAVDRIAFAGQVPVNVTEASPGQYIVPVQSSSGGIEGIARNEADLTLAEYMRAVGKVIAIEDDGRARIIVKVA